MATDPVGPLMQIGEVSELIGLSQRTIRYYGEVDLAPPSARSEGGFRLYSAEDVARLRVIMQMKPLGFSLEQMRDLLDARARLADIGGPDRASDEYRYLLARLAEFHEAASARVTELSAQLRSAEAFAAGLARDLSAQS